MSERRSRVGRIRGRRLRRRSGAALGLLASQAGLLAGPASQAGAYPQDPNNCNDASLHWQFQNNPLWIADGVDRRPWVRAAINTLESELARDFDNTPLMTVTEDGGIDVQIAHDPGGVYGSSECDMGAALWVNSFYTSDPKFFYKVGRHEMFHLGGAEHGGNDDSWSGDDPPTMSTCIDWPTFRSGNGLSQDDAAYETWLHGAPANRQLHANIGFEQGTSWWSHNGGQWVYKTSGGTGGPGYILWSPTVPDGDWVHQVVTVHTGNDNESYRAVVNSRELASSYKSAARVVLRWRPIEHQYDPSNTCEYPDGVQNPNDYETTGSWSALAESSWEDLSTAWQQIESSWVNPANHDGMELQVRVYGYSLDGTTVVPVAIDNARGEGT